MLTPSHTYTTISLFNRCPFRCRNSIGPLKWLTSGVRTELLSTLWMFHGLATKNRKSIQKNSGWTWKISNKYRNNSDWIKNIGIGIYPVYKKIANDFTSMASHRDLYPLDGLPWWDGLGILWWPHMNCAQQDGQRPDTHFFTHRAHWYSALEQSYPAGVMTTFNQYLHLLGITWHNIITWRFPKMGEPPNHPISMVLSLIASILIHFGVPPMETPTWHNKFCWVAWPC